jgi:alkanesulfonate monooxygenase SsuD/methylene tetrahydromethanopterin reductase-like flavin-dependent oxidoreductase (luciferase family)
MEGFALGIFDSMDLGDGTAGEVLDGRLRFAQDAERLGVGHYHVTEHHGTELSVCPSPNLFLAALSQRTRRMRIGALVYVLPAYDLLRLAEELSALDQLCGGRLDLGVGSGVSPYEIAHFGIAPEEMKPRYSEARDALLQALASGRLRHSGTLLPDYDVQLSVTPVQRPHPPVWYASGNPRSAVWAAENDVNFVGRWNGGSFVQTARTYWDAWQAAREDASDESAAGAQPRVGVSATVLIGPTEAAARERFDRAQALFGARMMKVWHDNGNHQVDALADGSAQIEAGNMLVGTMDSVREQVVAQVREAPLNYFEIKPLFGDLSYEEGVANLTAFCEGVMPAVRAAAQPVLGAASSR